MKEILEKIRNIESECCVSIIFNTHRNKPDIQKDVIMSKNLIAETEQRLMNILDKRQVASLMSRIKQLAEGIDHSHNLDSIALFVNDDISEVVRMPIEVENRVVIGRSFATRDLVLASKLNEDYYVLLLSYDKARLIEASDDHEIGEVFDRFPIENINLYPSSDKEQSKSKQVDLMKEEFFNRVDKALWMAINPKPHDVVICTEERNFYHFMKITDHPEKIIGHLNLNRMEEKNYNIISDAWPVVLNRIQERNRQRITELQQAMNNGKFIFDPGEIWRALNEGRGQTLFIQQGIFKPARISNNLVEVIDGQVEYEQEEVVDDIIEKMVEVNMKNGGDVVFLPEDDLKQYQGLALVTRF